MTESKSVVLPLDDTPSRRPKNSIRSTELKGMGCEERSKTGEKVRDRGEPGGRPQRFLHFGSPFPAPEDGENGRPGTRHQRGKRPCFQEVLLHPRNERE